MDRILQDVNGVVGVTGSFACDGEGEVLARALPSVFDGATLSTVARIAAQTVAGLETARRRKVTDMDLVYGDGRLVVKNLGNGYLCILCVRNINVPLLNLTANLAARKLSERLKEGKRKTTRSVESLPLISDFIEELLQEFGDRGFGRENLLQVVQKRLEGMQIQYPLLRGVEIVDGRMDLSSLESASDEEIRECLGLLLEEIYLGSAERLGPKAAQFKYSQARNGFWLRNEEACQRLNLAQVIKAMGEEKGSPPLAGVELKL
ncbi:MAG TPA: hypothetical protein DCP08_01040 [Chloroflexi bacterium]|nr:hypothetical protein [Chloroflexota bacterium]